VSRNLIFVTGTRADFGKLKPLIRAVENSPDFESSLFVTGMHTLGRYGYTVDEVYKAFGEHRLSEGFRSIYTFMNQVPGEAMDRVLANTIQGLSHYVQEFRPDMIVVHGDRVEALAGAIVGALRNIRVAHIEGGELSGTIDELVRHSITKLSHVHFVANEEAARRLRQLGELRESVFVIGSPDIDVMLSSDLPSIEEVRDHYGIGFERWAVVILHPVTTDPEGTASCVKQMVDALLASEGNFVLIHPNNDEGCDAIFDEYTRLEGHARFLLFPSMRMEAFLTLLKHCDFILGNSSAGIREAPVYGVPTVNIAARQSNRFEHESIVNVEGVKDAIQVGIREATSRGRHEPCYHFGDGRSAGRFLEALTGPLLWEVPEQKQFVDVPLAD